MVYTNGALPHYFRKLTSIGYPTCNHQNNNVPLGMTVLELDHYLLDAETLVGNRTPGKLIG